MKLPRTCLLLTAWMIFATPIPAADATLSSIDVFPQEIKLDGPRSWQRLIVIGKRADGSRVDLSRTVTPLVGDATIARFDNGFIHPVGPGATELKIETHSQTATVKVTVSNTNAETPVGFTTEIIPLLNKLGCNQGACHGAQHGKGGFRLSLFGFDPEFDHAQIVKSAEGRRIVLSDPERSILLLKPSLTMEHGGGERMKAGSWEYARLKQWLEDGVPEPRREDPIVTKLEVYPPKRVLQAGEQQQIAVRATWSNGRTEDVTLSAQYDSLNDALAKVTPYGLVTTLGRGETHVMIRYCGQATVFQATVPYEASPQMGELREHTRGNFIDDHLAAKWKSLNLAPSAPCNDAEFLRRIHLDTIGTLPTPDEIKKFLVDQDPQKRVKAIDAVLTRPEFVDYWAYKWGDLLRINRDVLEPKGMWSFHNWVRASLRDQQPVDEFVRDIITAEGSTYLEGPANYYRIGSNASEWAETTTQVFLGIRMQCAKCHHHPFEKWSQDDYYGMAAFFTRMGTKNSQEFGLFGRETVVYLRPNGEQNHPRKGGIVKPHPLTDAPPLDKGGQGGWDDPFDRRRKLADWLASKDNPTFARNLANRFWGYLMGRGLVEPLDDLRATNPATNPELLDALAKDFAASNFNLKHLLRTIMNSTSYQLSSTITPGNAADKENVFFARHTVKRLGAEQLADALDQATGTQEKYQGLPLGTRAIQLPDNRVRSYLLDVFGRPARQVTCECERGGTPNIAQALHLVNGDFVNAKISKRDGRVAKLIEAKKPLPELVDELYLVTLSRPPRPEESESAVAWIGKAATPQAGAEDLLWVLLNSKEFLFNH